MSSLRANRFTLIEILVAALSLAVLLAAVVVPVRGALREREHANEKGAEQFRLRRARDRVLDDLHGLLYPGSTLAGSFVGTRNEAQDGRQDTLAFATGNGSRRAGGVVRVQYELAEADDGDGCDWIRTETINPLSDDADNTVETTILRNVRSLEFSYYDGTSWQESWDSTTGSSRLPKAIAVSFALAPEDEEDEPVPHRLLVPVAIETAGSDRAAGGGGRP